MASNSIIANVGMNTTGFEAGRNRLMSQAASLNASLGGIGAGLGVVGLIAFVKSATDTATELKNIAAQSGATVEEIQELNFAFTQNGATMKDATSSQRMVDMESAFNKQGISVRDADGKLRKYKDVLMDTADVIKGTESESAKAAIAFQLFGDSGFKLVQALDGGSEGLKALADEAQKSGQIIDGEANEAIVSFSDELAKLGGTAKNVATQALGEVFLAMGRISRAAGDFSVNLSAGSAWDAFLAPGEKDPAAVRNDAPQETPHVQMGKLKDTLESILSIEGKRAALHITEGEALKNNQKQLEKLSSQNNQMMDSEERRLRFNMTLKRGQNELALEATGVELRANEEARKAKENELDLEFKIFNKRTSLGKNTAASWKKILGLQDDIAKREFHALKVLKSRNDLITANAKLIKDLADEEKIRNEAGKAFADDEAFQKRKNDALAKRLEIDKELLKIATQKAQLESTLAGQTASLATTKEDRSKFGLEELANSNPYGFGTAEFNADVLKAREVVRLESIAESARFDYGNSARASGFLNQADEIRSGISSLRSNERNPFASLEDGIRATEEAIKDLPGMVVVPKVGP